MDTRKMPQDNKEVWEGIHDLLEDPEAHMAKMKKESLERASAQVSAELLRRLSMHRRRTFGRMLLDLFVAKDRRVS